MTSWKEKLKGKPVRYWIRAEIEEIIKENNIDRTKFYEYSKTGYVDVIKKFYYSFVDYKKYPYKSKYGLSYCWLHLRTELKCSQPVTDDNWIFLLQKIKDILPVKKDERLYLILSENWVYEGYINEIIDVLSETDCLLEDFYIVSKKYKWFLAYCDDGMCAVLYQK